MRITNISVWNFRLLRDFRILLEDDLSVMIGKNNTGKTSMLVALSKFLSPGESRQLAFDDISIDIRELILTLLTRGASVDDNECIFSVGLELTITYDEKDNLSPVWRLITNLDPHDNQIVLVFYYDLSGKRLNELRHKWFESKEKEDAAAEAFLRQNLVEALGKLKRRSKGTVERSIDLDLDRDKLSLEDTIAFKFVSARRDVTNKDNDQTLSTQTARLYKSLSGKKDRKVSVDEFKATLRKADGEFSSAYEKIFEGLIGKVSKFGGIRPGESTIKIASTLQDRDILSGNTTVMYEHAQHDLPEHYNGLGYMNLISMIFEIDLLMKEFQKAQAGAGAALNILFIEEPEAHTHPQMQYIFIKNIRELLATARGNLSSIQTILSTHSAHIVSVADFDCIKYLQRSENQVQAKNLSELESQFSDDEEEKRRFRLLKQYLTLHRAELFFADKIILIEGDTERILLPAMMQKLDQKELPKNVMPLLSQNISVVEVGAHSKVYEKFIDFLGLKTLIITDFDSGYNEPKEKDGKKENCVITCCPNDDKAKYTSNSSLCFYHGKHREDIDYFLGLKCSDKICCKVNGTWKATSNGHVFTAFQTEEDGYHARSFEDAFFSLNKDFLKLGHDRFPSLTKKWYDDYMNGNTKPLDFVERAVNSKPSLAIEILLNSEVDEEGNAYCNWKIPAYIEEGLKWLRGDFDA